MSVLHMIFGAIIPVCRIHCTFVISSTDASILLQQCLHVNDCTLYTCVCVYGNAYAFSAPFWHSQYSVRIAFFGKNFSIHTFFCFHFNFRTTLNTSTQLYKETKYTHFLPNGTHLVYDSIQFDFFCLEIGCIQS